MAQRTRSPEDEATKLLDEYLRQVVGQRKSAPVTADELTGETQKFVKRFLDACLEAEMDVHLSKCEANRLEQLANEDGEVDPKNKRNGYSHKTVTDGNTQVKIDIPRDRQGKFDPIVVGKYERKIPGMEQKIISMYARGMSNREISAHLEEIYGVGASAETISRVTDTVLDDIQEWRNRPLDDCYPVVFFDALRIKVRESGQVKSKSMFLALGIRMDGSRDVLGMWLLESEGASRWTQVFNEIRNRGCQDILIAVTDGLKGMTDAIETVFPDTRHQTCIVHLIRNSVAYVPHKDMREVCKWLRGVYTAPTVEEARRRLDEFAASDLGKRNRSIPKMWNAAWEQITPIFDFPDPIRRLIYTTNAIEALNRSIRKVIKNRGLFPSDESAYKLVWLALMNCTKDWGTPVGRWREALSQIAVVFEGRI